MQSVDPPQNIAVKPHEVMDPAAVDVRRYGQLFIDVQMQGVFEDGKTFVDAIPRQQPPEALGQLYLQAKDEPGFSLAEFVRTHFHLPMEATPPHDAGPAHSIGDHIKGLWSALMRTTTQIGQAGVPAGTLLSLPHPYVVPGGRFREIYYWDSYFTMLGLVEDGFGGVAEGMLNNFASQIDRYGHIPNGSRSYFLSRSQPPFFFKMVECVFGANQEAGLAAYLPQLQREYAYWMQGEAQLAPGESAGHVVRVADGHVLNRFWDEHDDPREESYRDDVHTAQASGRPPAQVYRDLRAAAESGWDFSSRWCADPHRLETIETTAILPIDLNAVMWGLERAISRACEHRADQGGATEFRRRAADREAAINRHLWSTAHGHYVDCYWERQSPSAFLSAAALVPLYFGLASREQAQAMARITEQQLLKKNGLVTTLVTSGQQWDAPNGWAPLQWMAIEGLRRYGYDELARQIAYRWLGLLRRVYKETGKMLEKYNVIETCAGGGGEYPTQDGFGWTNGTFVALARRYPEAMRN